MRTKIVGRIEVFNVGRALGERPKFCVNTCNVLGKRGGQSRAREQGIAQRLLLATTIIVVEHRGFTDENDLPLFFLQRFYGSEKRI